MAGTKTAHTLEDKLHFMTESRPYCLTLFFFSLNLTLIPHIDKMRMPLFLCTIPIIKKTYNCIAIRIMDLAESKNLLGYLVGAGRVKDFTGLEKE